MKTLNIEIVLKNESPSSKQSITTIVQHFLSNINYSDVKNGNIDKFDTNSDPILYSDVKAIIFESPISKYFFSEKGIDFSKFTVNWHVYSLDHHGPVMQVEDDGESEENVATHLMLPSSELYNLWENLFYDNAIKENLLQYSQTMMEFSDKGVDPNVINCNRVILLHGPPGTGKTSLCKALAQKLSIRMNARYNSSILIEINSHSLFSKWFSESGKLVTKLFTKIREIVENPSLLVCVLIDEVESLAHARNQCLSGNEPSDAIRVVNAVLTQIDQIKRYSNVLILTTSNISESIDLAFIDRADIKQFLGLPSPRAIENVYSSCIEELLKVGIIKQNEGEGDVSLLRICEKSTGLSGRSLRKIPFIAHALFLSNSCTDLSSFLSAMEKAIDREKTERKYFENNSLQS